MGMTMEMIAGMNKSGSNLPQYVQTSLMCILITAVTLVIGVIFMVVFSLGTDAPISVDLFARSVLAGMIVVVIRCALTAMCWVFKEDSKSNGE